MFVDIKLKLLFRIHIPGCVVSLFLLFHKYAMMLFTKWNFFPTFDKQSHKNLLTTNIITKLQEKKLSERVQHHLVNLAELWFFLYRFHMQFNVSYKKKRVAYIEIHNKLELESSEIGRRLEIFDSRLRICVQLQEKNLKNVISPRIGKFFSC